MTRNGQKNFFVSLLVAFCFVVNLLIPIEYAQARSYSSRSYSSRSYTRQAPRVVQTTRVKTPPPAKATRVKTPPSAKTKTQRTVTIPAGKTKTKTFTAVPSGKKGNSKIIKVPPTGKGKDQKLRTAPSQVPGTKKTIANRIPGNASDKAALKTRAKKAKTEKMEKQRRIVAASHGTTYTDKSFKAERDRWTGSNADWKKNQRNYRTHNDWDYYDYNPRFVNHMIYTPDPLFWLANGALLNSMWSHRDGMTSSERLQMEQIKRDVERMKAEGKTAPANYVPASAPPSVVYKQDMLVPEEIVMYTGSTTGVYYPICNGTPSTKGAKGNAAEYGTKVLCKATNGGDYNIKQYIAGKTEMFLAQADNVYHYQKKGVSFPTNQFVTHQEPMMLITAKKSKIGNIEDIDKKTTIYVMGGAKISWEEMADFATNDTFLGFGGNSDYAKAKMVPFKPDQLDAVVGKISGNKRAAMLVVMGTSSNFLKNLDSKHGEKLRLVPINDDRFESIADQDGKRIYSRCTVKAGTLPNLQAGKWWGQNDVETLAVDALWIMKDSLSSDATTLMITDTIDELRLTTN